MAWSLSDDIQQTGYIAPVKKKEEPYPVQTELPVGNTTEQVTTPVQTNTDPSIMDKAQADYDKAVVARDDAQTEQIKSLQDIVDRYKPETKEDAEAREAKEKRKRDLLAMIQLGANIGNMVNASTGGHMGSRSVETPQLVSSYDKARDTELTHRMKRDEKHNAARQEMVKLKESAAQGDLKSAMQRLLQAQKGEQEMEKQRAISEREANKQKFTAEENEKNRKSREGIAAQSASLQRARLAKQDEWHKAQQAATEEKIKIDREYKKNGGSRGGSTAIIPIRTELNGEEKLYQINSNYLKNDHIAGELVSYLPKKYIDELPLNPNGKDISIKVGEYIKDKQAHADNPVEWEEFNKELAHLSTLEPQGIADDWLDEEEDVVDDWNSL